MNAKARSIDGGGDSESSSLLRTLLLCDLVESTALVERLGDRAAAELIRKHDRLARTIADRHGGREIDKTDGFLMMFDRPIQAVAFALDYQRGLKQLNAAENATLASRVGIHVGDVVVWDNSSEDIAKGAKPVEVEGLVKPIASRLMSLALPGQILLSNIAYALAHRAQGELGIQLEKVRWRTHGRYRFRGIPDPVPVFEVGEDGVAPLKAPPWSSKAHREVPFWRRPATMVIEGLVLLALAAIPVVMFLRPEPAIAFANRDWVVVGNLQNLTGESVFDEALESALRIGLEQSRYVNVLPDLKVRDTVKRMQRDPDTTKVDRAIGSEVAIRDGAKALILPTIAEIGGRVRITAEVIDPRTLTTVYSESADGTGAESVLPSLDTINSRLRVRLGEALASVSEDSLPLEKVATKNLDALRAYSLGIRTTVMGDRREAIELLKEAVRLDSEFAQARVSLAGLLFNIDKRDEAAVQLRAALAEPGRLSARSRFLAEGWLANLTSARDAVAKWKALAQLYPDLFAAHGAHGYYAWNYLNDYPSAIAATRLGATRQNPNRALSHYLLGTLYLGTEQYAESLAQFTEAESLGAQFENNYYAALFAAQRQYPRMRATLEAGRTQQSGIDPASAYTAQLAFAIDQAHWPEAKARIAEAQRLESIAGGLDPALVQSTDLALRVLLAPLAERAAVVDAYLGRRIEKVDSSARVDPVARDGRILFNAWLAARHGLASTARATMAQAGAQARSGNYPSLSNSLSLVESALAVADGKPQHAVDQLTPLLDGTEPCAAHAVLMDAQAALGDVAAAREQARWLARGRGRAYTEQSAGVVWIPYDVVLSTIAMLDIAEFSNTLGERDEARRSLALFTAAWPDRDQPVALAARVEVLRRALDVTASPKASAAQP